MHPLHWPIYISSLNKLMNRFTTTVTLLIAALTGAMLWVAYDIEHFSVPTDMLPMTFSHADHGGENCLVCHHNFQDDTGGGACIQCHQTDPSVNLIIREQFHDLCMNCHTERNSQGEPAGPLRVCDDCHTVDTQP